MDDFNQGQNPMPAAPTDTPVVEPVAEPVVEPTVEPVAETPVEPVMPTTQPDDTTVPPTDQPVV